MDHVKNHGNKEFPIAILSGIQTRSCIIPPYIYSGKGLRMIVLVSLIVLLRGIHDFSHGAALPYIPIHSVE